MDQRSEESFSVQVFTLQEEVNEEAHMETYEEENQVQSEQNLSVLRQRGEQELTVMIRTHLDSQMITVEDASRAPVFQLPVEEETDCCQVGAQSFIITTNQLSLLLQFTTPHDMKNFRKSLKIKEDEERRRKMEEEERRKMEEEERRKMKEEEERRKMEEEERSQICASSQSSQLLCLSQQQSLLQDYLRTATYQRVFLNNEADFRDKVVLDVCCGSGILSFFAVQAGASRVYAVESSPMAKYTQILVQSNHLSERIRILEGDVDQVVCPDMVDVIVSEPMGHMLLNERLMGRFLYARKWLKPNGLMFPSFGDIHLAPFSDEQLYMEHSTRAGFWQQRSFYGVNLSALHTAAGDEFFRLPIVDTFDMHVLMAKSVKHCINFMEAKEEDLLRMEIPFVFPLLQTGLVHGLAFWFDVAFQGSTSTMWFSTAPSEPLTRWSQVRCLLHTPLFGKLGQTLSGTVLLAANSRQSYDIHITATVDQTGFRSGNILDLHNPFFR
ncbi:histone-arginine methyltransferase CARM1-like [Embiotoca jacksoni]|uniref:histone-arginine methyltransferase CARM1-like n=1 Tax=Embiotoca jacksoni TaxID=100190 RepID=UPI00370375F1